MALPLVSSDYARQFAPRVDAPLGSPLDGAGFVTFDSAAAGWALPLLGSSRARDLRGFLDPPAVSS